MTFFFFHAFESPHVFEGFLGGSVGKESAYNAGDCLQGRRPGFDPWVRKILCRRKWQPTPLFLPGEVYGQGSLVGYGSWNHRIRPTELLNYHHNHVFE